MADSDTPRDPASLAIEQVLAAEREAEARLQACRQEAEAVLSAARKRAAAIRRRMEMRIRELHDAHSKQIAAEIAALSLDADRSESPRDDEAAIGAAVRRVAAALTGGG